MSRPVPMLAVLGTVLGVVGAVGWHWDPLARLWPPAWIDLPSGPPMYSGVIPAGSVSDWGQPWWPPLAVLPLVGAAFGVGLGTLASWQRRHPVLGLLTIVALGVLIGIASAVAWHCTPISGIGWAGGFFEEIDLGYPAVGLVVGLAAAVTAHAVGFPSTGHRSPSPPTP